MGEPWWWSNFRPNKYFLKVGADIGPAEFNIFITDICAIVFGLLMSKPGPQNEAYTTYYCR